VRYEVVYTVYARTVHGSPLCGATQRVEVDADGTDEARDLLIGAVLESFSHAAREGSMVKIGECDGWNGMVSVNPRHVEAVSVYVDSVNRR
jgi:hypothetical protein